MTYHYDRCTTHLGDMGRSFVLFNIHDISTKYLLYLKCYLLSLKIHKKVVNRFNRATNITVSVYLRRVK